ncbi:MAG: sensor histidine kinase [Acidobacteria bacterium]|nr:sensor histidine kinase [Acidobacteriota bacterium]
MIDPAQRFRLRPGEEARPDEHLRITRTGAFIGWATLAVVVTSTLAPHLHHRHMRHGAIWALSGAAVVANGLGYLFPWRRIPARRAQALLWAWTLAVFAFVTALTFFGGGFSSDFYVLYFPAVVFAATLLPSRAGAAGGVVAALLYVAAVSAVPEPIAWGNVLVRAGGFVATAALATEVAALERLEARRRAATQAQAEARAMLLQEVHHRVKNDLQTVAELLSLEAYRTPSRDVKEVVEDVVSQIQSMAAVHKLLSTDPGETDATTLASRVVTLLWQKWGRRGITAGVEGDIVPLRVERATCLALAVNELVTNAFRHAFPQGRDGSIEVTIRRCEEEALVSISDDGIGFHANGAPPEEDLGLALVRKLVAEGLGGSLRIAPRTPGTLAEITFPLSGPHA